MDYKFVILLILLCGLILFLTKEFSNIYKKLDETNEKLTTCIDSNSDTIKRQVRNDIGVCLNKVKGFNTECFQKIRRMDMFGSQPVIGVTNHWTDADTEANSKDVNPLTCLSDVNPMTCVSDVNHMTCLSDAIQMKKSSSKNQSKNPTDELYFTDEPEKKESQNFVIAYENKLNNLTEQKEKESDLANLSHKKTLTPDSDTSDNSLDIDTQSQNTISNSVSKSKTSSEKLSDKLSDNLSETRSNRSSKSEPILTSEKKSHSSKKSNSSEKKSNKSEPSISLSSKISSTEESSDGVEIIMPEAPQNDISKKISEFKKPEQKQEQEYEECEITIGSKKGKNGIIPTFVALATVPKKVNKDVKKSDDLDNSDKSNNSEEENQDDISMATTEMANITLTNFRNINDYTIDSLKKIAKLKSIPITVKDNSGQRRNLKKTELYNKIKNTLDK